MHNKLNKTEPFHMYVFQGPSLGCKSLKILCYNFIKMSLFSCKCLEMILQVSWTSQIWRFWPIWVLRWSFKLCTSKNTLFQTSQEQLARILNLCVWKWLFRFLFAENHFYILHKYKVFHMYVPGYDSLDHLFVKIFCCITHKHQVFHLYVSGNAY